MLWQVFHKRRPPDCLPGHPPLTSLGSFAPPYASRRGRTIQAYPLCNLAARTTFSRSMATVIGPTPPGTGVIADAFSRTLA